MPEAKDTARAPRHGRIVWMLVSLFLLASGGMGAFGRWFYLQERKAIREDRCGELQAVASLKVEQLEAWRSERLGDAQLFATELSRPETMAWFRAPGAQPALASVRARLLRFRAAYKYRDVILATPDGRLLLSLDPQLKELEPVSGRLAAQATAARTPVFGDFFRCATCREVHVDVAAAVLDDAQQPVAVILVRSDPARQLYPLIQHWPLPSPSAETLLVRRDGDSVLFLNVLRHRADPALTIRIPLTNTTVQAVQAVRGKQGISEGRDYRGVAVVSDLRPVRGAPWFMVAKQDLSEILAEVHYRGKVIAGLVTLSCLLFGALLAFLFYFGQASLYYELFRHTKVDVFAEPAVPEGVARRAWKLSGLAAGLVFLTGAVVLAGWAFEVEALKSVLPGYVSMKANTAVGFLFAGLALASLTWAVRHGRIPWCARTYAGVVFLLGVGTLAEYVLDFDLGIDQFLFQEPSGAAGTLAPGRMAPATAITFVLAGCALLLSSARRAVPLAQHAAILVALLGWIPLLGYLYGAPNLYGIGHYTQMSVHTAAAFIVLALGMLLLHPGEGVMLSLASDSLGSWLLRRLLPFVVLFPLVLGWLRASGERLGLFEGVFGVALMMAILSILLLALVWWSARALTRIDNLRRENERRVRESRELLRATLYGIGDGVIATSAEGLVSQMNPVAERLTGWREAEAVGKPLPEVFRIVSETTREEIANPVAMVVRTGRIVGLANHTLLIARDGKEIPIADSGAPIYNAQGEIVGVVLVFRDQTEARLAEARVQAEIRKLNAVFESAPIAMLVLDEHAGIVWANTAALALSGAGTPDGLLGQQPGSAVRCLHRAKDPRGCGFGPDCPLCPLRRGVEAVIAGGTPVHSLELTLSLLRNGEPEKIWLRVGVEPITLDNSRHVIVALDDITARKQAEEQAHAARAAANRLLEISEQSRQALLSAAEDQKRIGDELRETETRFRELFSNMSSGAAVYQAVADGADFVFRDINEAGLQHTRRARDEVIGKTITEVFPGIREMGLLDVFRRVWQTGRAEHHPPVRYKDNTLAAWFDNRVYRIRTGEIVALFDDITEHKRFEEMRTAKEASDAASRAKSSFLANVSHEIRTPLNAILGFAQLLQREATLSAEQQRLARTIRRSGEHLLALINDVLEMSRLEAGRTALHPVAFDSHALLAEVTALLRPGAEAKSLRLLVECAPGLPRFVRADENKLREVLHNLLGNAVKFTRFGTVVLRAGFEADAAAPRLHFQVEDTGPGITPEDQQRLFQYFEQARVARPSETGTGLGLAISRELVRLMGGDITYDTKIGEGTTFRFDVRVELANRADAPPPRPSRRVIGLEPEHPPVRVLVVDDSEDNRELLIRLLGPAGFAIRQAADGRQAIREFGTWRPRLILLDLRMPEMGGMEVIRQIRPLPGGHDVRIIVVTASAMADKAREALAAGADAFYVKPVDDSDLLKTIAELLGLTCIWEVEDREPSVPEPAAADVREAFSDGERRAIREAAINGDFDRVQEQIRRAEANHPGVAQGLLTVAERYDTRRLLELLGEEEGV